MPKAKRRKTQHNKHQPTTGELSHEEIWDDSALIRSWDAALAEYEYYHSLHAKGEDVEAVLDAAEAAEAGIGRAAENGNKGDEDEDEDEEEVEDGEVSEQEQEDGEISDEGDLAVNVHQAENRSGLGKVSGVPEKFGPEPPPGHPGVRQATTANDAETTAQHSSDVQTQANQSHNQSLENIKMAYYWAGYYSGFYDGQQQAQLTQQGQGGAG